MSDSESRETKRATVSDDVIAGYVYDTVLKTQGVYGMGIGLSASAVAKNILGYDKRSRGIRVVFDEESGYTIDVNMVVEFGVNIPETAWNVQKRVFEGLKTECGIETENINIHVQGVHAK